MPKSSSEHLGRLGRLVHLREALDRTVGYLHQIDDDSDDPVDVPAECARCHIFFAVPARVAADAVKDGDLFLECPACTDAHADQLRRAYETYGGPAA